MHASGGGLSLSTYCCFDHGRGLKGCVTVTPQEGCKPAEAQDVLPLSSTARCIRNVHNHAYHRNGV